MPASVRDEPARTAAAHSEIEPAASPVPDDAADSVRAAAMLPAQVLQPGEVVILLLKPSAWYILLDALGSITALVLVIAVALTADSWGWTRVGRKDLLLLGVGLLGLRLFWQFLEWLSSVYLLTDRRVVVVFGVLRVSIFETPLKNVQHTNATFSIRERMFGLGTLSFATAGTAVTETFWRMIARPLDVHRVVVQALNRYR